MASTALLGFLKGASGAALDSIELREKEEAERRKMELAASISHEYFTKQELFKEGLPSNVQARKERQRKMEREEELHPLQVESSRLGIDSVRQEMELGRNRDARAERLTDAQIEASRASAARSRAGLDGSGEDAGYIGSASLGAELVNAYKDSVDGLEKYAGVPREVVEQTASRVIANVKARNPGASGAELLDKARAQFVYAMSVLRQGTAPVREVDPKTGQLTDEVKINSSTGTPIMAPWDPSIVVEQDKRRRGLGG